eukprot:SAG31_NODE_5229_length_2660_cov_26.620070_2_plen_171_part_00
MQGPLRSEEVMEKRAMGESNADLLVALGDNSAHPSSPAGAASEEWSEATDDTFPTITTKADTSDQSMQPQNDQHVQQQKTNRFISKFLQQQKQCQKEIEDLNRTYCERLEAILVRDLDIDAQMDTHQQTQRELEAYTEAKQIELSECWNKVCNVVDPLTQAMAPTRTGGY